MYLSPQQLQAVTKTERILGRAWERAEPLALTEKTLRGLMRATATVVYTVDPEGALASLHSNHASQARAAAERALLAGLNRYKLQGKDRFANHAVDDTVLYAGDEAGLAGFRRHVHDHGLPCDHTLRVVVQHDDRTCGWVGFLRSGDEGTFQPHERAMLQYLAPQLDAIITATHVLDVGRLRGLDLQAMLDTFGEPAMICSEQGQILVVNNGARRRFPNTPEWLSDLGGSVTGPTVAEHAKVTPIVIDDRKLMLVVARPGAAAGEPGCPAGPATDELPPYLASVVELMSEGLSDRQIAERTGRSYNTIRTYVRRLYARYGVTNRTQLLLALGR